MPQVTEAVLARAGDAYGPGSVCSVSGQALTTMSGLARNLPAVPFWPPPSFLHASLSCDTRSELCGVRANALPGQRNAGLD
jgi:hypothetical protein